MYPSHPSATWKHQIVTIWSNLNSLLAPHQGRPSAGSPSVSKARFIPSHLSCGLLRSVTRSQRIPSADFGIVSRRVASGSRGILLSRSGSVVSSTHPLVGMEARGVKGIIEMGPAVPEGTGLGAGCVEGHT